MSLLLTTALALPAVAPVPNALAKRQNACPTISYFREVEDVISYRKDPRALRHRQVVLITRNRLNRHSARHDRGRSQRDIDQDYPVHAHLVHGLNRDSDLARHPDDNPRLPNHHIGTIRPHNLRLACFPARVRPCVKLCYS